MASVPQWISTKLETGMWPDIAPRKAKGFYRSGRWVRYNPQLQPMGGWEGALFVGARYHGTARTFIEFADNNANAMAALGTHTSAWIMRDSQLYNITPVESYVALNNAVATVSGSPTVTVVLTANGFAAGQLMRFPTMPTIDGIALTGTVTTPYYVIATVTTDSFTFAAQSNAVAGGAGLGGLNLDLDVFLRPGLEFGLAGAGYGFGAYDVGTYGGSNSGTFRARVWTGGSIGELLVMCPRGGATYELNGQAILTANNAELVSQGAFTVTATLWTLGTGWAQDFVNSEIDATNVTAGTFLTTSLYQGITVDSGKYARIRFTLRNYASGTLQLKMGLITATPFGAATPTISANGRYTYEFWNTTAAQQNITFAAAGNFTASITNVTARHADTLCKNTTAPASSLGVVCSPQGHEMCFGCTDAATSRIDPLLVSVSGRLNTRDWTTSASNEARSFYLRDGSEIRQAIPGPDGVIYFLTDKSLWEAQYIGLPDVWSFNAKGKNCGTVGARAACFDGFKLKWMSNRKEFFEYDGTRPIPIFSPGRDTVFNNIIPGAAFDLVEAHAHTHGEVWFTYPDRRDGIGAEISRYAAVCGDTSGAPGRWLFGDAVSRNAWSPSSNIGFPLAAEGGLIYYHEKGTSADGAASLNWSALATGIEIGDGNTLAEVSGFMPDHKDAAGPYNVRFIGYAATHDGSTPSDSTPQPVAVAAEYVMSFFVIGRTIDIELSGDYDVKIGDPTYLVADTGDQF